MSNDLSRRLDFDWMPPMYDAMIGNWWAVALRGGAAVLFGVLALLVPGLTLGTLVTLFALYAIADGLLALALGRHEHAAGTSRRGFVVDGVAGLALGALALLWSDITAFTLVLLVGLRALVAGGVALLPALRLVRAGTPDLLFTVAAAVSLLFGVVLLVLPSMGIAGVLLWIAIHALVTGTSLIVLALHLRGMAHGVNDGDGMMAPV